MNEWQKKREVAIVEADDFQDNYKRNGLEVLFFWKAKYPKFKITLFTIPDLTSEGMFQLLRPHIGDWIEIAVHGFDHSSNFECYEWSREKTASLMDRVMNWNANPNDARQYKSIFKAPGWSITGGTNGYPAHEKLPVFEDPQCVYKALNDMNFLIFDREYNDSVRPEGTKTVVVDREPNLIHMHTWDMVTGDKNGRNGFRQVEEEHGVPWDQNTDFYFISEAWDQQLFEICKNK